MQHVAYCCVIQWEPAHDGLGCEQFAEWKKDNDPELQAQGLAAYLNQEGIGRKLGDVTATLFYLLVLFVQSVLLVGSDMHWPKEDVCTLNVTCVLLSFVLDVVIYLKR